MITPTFTPTQIADQSCRCTRCEDARRQEVLEAVKRAIAQFESKEE